ncbi:MAG: hypothetical protein ACPLXP_02090 [Microgenomates group bacterium]
MLVATHALVGGFLATKISNPIIFSPLLVFSHLLLDRIPHWDLGTGFKKRKMVVNFLLGGGDLLAGTVICWFIFQRNSPFNPLLWTGVFFSLLPDFLEFPALFLNWRFFPFDKLELVHSHYFHRKAKFPQGLILQIIIIGLILFLA